MLSLLQTRIRDKRISIQLLTMEPEQALPSELIELLVTNPKNATDIVRLCTVNKYFAKRCYDGSFWATYLNNISKKEYLDILLGLLDIGNNKLFLYLIDNKYKELSTKNYLVLLERLAERNQQKTFFRLLNDEYQELSSNDYRYLIELVARRSNKELFLRLINNPAPGHINEDMALLRAYNAALFYENYEIVKLLDEKIVLDIAYIRKFEKMRSLISFARDLERNNKIDFEKFSILRNKYKYRSKIIPDIIGFGGSYEQLKKLMEFSDSTKTLDLNISYVISRILRNFYGNISFLEELFDKGYDFTKHITSIATANNKTAQKLLLEKLDLHDFNLSMIDIDYLEENNHGITSKYLLKKLIRDYPNDENVRRILFNSPGTLDDDEYLELVNSMNPTINEINKLYNLCDGLGYNYIAGILQEEYEFE